jgi:hypothetical protein
MWSRRLILATLVAAAAVTLTRHGPARVPGIAAASSQVATSFR